MKATYINHMGDDITVVNAARVSFNKETTHSEVTLDGYELYGKDIKLINYLANHNHWTPFSHCMVTMREKVPIFVARQRFKHMVGFSYNEVSRRYVSDDPEFFTPDEWRGAPTDGAKQGSSGTINFANDEINFIKWPYGELQTSIDDFHILCKNLYDYLINVKRVAPEQARMVLPQSMYTEYYVTGSLAAWARAYQLRIDNHSQKEIQDLAKQWDEVISPLFPVSWKALTNGSS